MKYSNEVNILLALIDQKDKEAVFFRTFLSETLLYDLDNFRTRLLEISAKNA